MNILLKCLPFNWYLMLAFVIYVMELVMYAFLIFRECYYLVRHAKVSKDDVHIIWQCYFSQKKNDSVNVKYLGEGVLSFL